MEIAAQLMMAVSLAACAGLRAWLPVLGACILVRAGYITLNPAFSFIARDDVLIMLGVATILEVLGDKFIAVDHFLDAVGTVARPAAGTLLASSMLAGMRPVTALILGLIVGGGTALTVHASKAVFRAKCTALLPVHGGVGNAAVSGVEDCITVGGIFCIVHAPLISFVVIVFALAGCIWMLIHVWKAGRSLVAGLRKKPAP